MKTAFRRRWIALIAAWLTLGVTLAAEPPFRLQSIDAANGTNIQALVETRPGAPLDAAGFVLHDGTTAVKSAPRAIGFRDSGNGVALIVALDASGSMRGRPINAIRLGLHKLVSRKRPQDRVAVMSFANDVRWETRWTATEPEVRAAFSNLTTRGNRTSLYDAIAAALDEFDRQSRGVDGFPLRRSILVISDGQDAGSEIRLPALLAKLDQSRHRVDAAAIASGQVNLDAFRRIARAGFGDLKTANSPEDLTAMLERGIDGLLDSQVLEFPDAGVDRDGLAHTLSLEHPASGWRGGSLTVVISKPPLWKRPAAIGGGLAALLVMALALGAILRRQRASRQGVFTPAAPSGAWSATPPPSQPAAPIERLPTEMETFIGDPRSFNLAVVSGPYTGQRVIITAAEFWIGARDNNHLCLNADQSVSGNHACIRREDGIFRLYDNGSLNGTFVNGQPVGQSVVALRTGDRIRVGMSELVMEGI